MWAVNGLKPPPPEKEKLPEKEHSKSSPPTKENLPEKEERLNTGKQQEEKVLPKNKAAKACPPNKERLPKNNARFFVDGCGDIYEKDLYEKWMQDGLGHGG